MTNTTSTKRKRRMAREPQAISETQADAGAAKRAVARSSSSTAEKPPSKTDEVLALLHRQEGATLKELVGATGWLPHTTRAALTGLKKKGHSIQPTKVDGVSRYAVNEPAAR